MENLYSRYANALLETAKEDKKDIPSLRIEIETLMQIFKKELRFARFLSCFDISNEEKFEVIDNVFKDFDHLLINFIKLIIKQSRSVFIYDIFKESLKVFDSYLKVERGFIYSKEPLSTENINLIKNTLEKSKGKIIELENVIDENIIGGIKVVLDNDIFDSTINKKIENLKKSLLKGGQ